LFGIILVVFGNRAAINTILGKNEQLGKKPQMTNKPEIDKAVLTQDVEPSNVDEKSDPLIERSIKNTLDIPKNEIKKEQEKSVKEKKIKTPILDDDANEPVINEVVKETPKTTIESDKPESATPTE
ncbi:MAG: hypothetical protein RL662_2332, partial [Bacteroidota bacterium]